MARPNKNENNYKTNVKGTSVVKSKSFNGAKLLARLRRESRKRAASGAERANPSLSPLAHTLENYVIWLSLSNVINRWSSLSNHNNEDLIEKYMRMKYWTQEFNKIKLYWALYTPFYI